MSYTLATLWHEKHRFLPAILAVTFSALLVALQCGMLLGTFSSVSVPVDFTQADVWVGSPGVESVDVGHTIPEAWESRLGLAGVERVEPYQQSFGSWCRPDGSTELCIVIGSRLQTDALGAVNALTPAMRSRLAEPGAVVVDGSDLGRLGLRSAGEFAQINGRRVRVVGLVSGLRGLAGPYVFCSLETARAILGLPEGQATYLLARCRRPGDAAAVVARLGHYRDMTAYTSTRFSLWSRWHWLSKTGGGIALGCAAVLGLLVGAVITSQTLYAATAASRNEFAVLRAMGIPGRRVALTVVTQSLWVGVTGVLLALPAILALSRVVGLLGARALLPGWLLAGTSALTLGMALASGLYALRSLRLIEPAVLLR